MVQLSFWARSGLSSQRLSINQRYIAFNKVSLLRSKLTIFSRYKSKITYLRISIMSKFVIFGLSQFHEKFAQTFQITSSGIQVFEACQSLNYFKFDPYFTFESDGKFLGQWGRHFTYKLQPLDFSQNLLCFYFLNLKIEAQQEVPSVLLIRIH